jgi:hypothetical protein
MRLVFESLQFRVHIVDKTAWVENRVPEGWVFRAQQALPVPMESLTGDTNILGAALADFEQSRPGDETLRTALGGRQNPRRVLVEPTERPKPAPRRVLSRSVATDKSAAGRRWSPQPLRPPLKPMTE